MAEGKASLYMFQVPPVFPHSFKLGYQIMAISLQCFLVLICISIFSSTIAATDPPLTLHYYKSTCPNVFDIVKKEMECHVLSDPRNAAFILRLHFHDCFVQGCDGSILLDDTIELQGEKKAPTNGLNSLKGFRIIDKIKNKLESECPGIVSCADILTIAARDAVILVFKMPYTLDNISNFLLLDLPSFLLSN